MPEGTREKYAIYLRKSRADLELEAIGQGETLAKHKARLLELAESKEIMPSQIEIYQEVVSGESISARPEMQRLLLDVYQRKFKGVLVVEVERLARGNTKDQGEVADAFQYSNTLIITPSKVFDPRNEFDQEYFEFGLFMSRREYNTIKRRMQAGKESALKSGNYLGSCRIYGYNIKRINKKERTLEVNPEEAMVVKWIFDQWTEDRRSCSEIARALTDMGIKTMKETSVEWNRCTISGILQNYHYIGKIPAHQRKTAKEYDLDSAMLITRTYRNQDFDLFQGKHEAIISKEQFEKAQSLFAASSPVKLNKQMVNPLSGLLHCKECGRAMFYNAYRSKGEKVSPRYIHPVNTRCKNTASTTANVVISALSEALQEYLDDFTVQLENASEGKNEANLEMQIDAYSNELEKIKKKRQMLFSLFEEGSYTKEEFLERKKYHTDRIEEIQVRIQELQLQKKEKVDHADQIVQLHQALDLLKDDSISAKEKNIFLKSFIKSIDYSGLDEARRPVIDVYLK